MIMRTDSEPMRESVTVLSFRYTGQAPKISATSLIVLGQRSKSDNVSQRNASASCSRVVNLELSRLRSSIHLHYSSSDFTKIDSARIPRMFDEKPKL